MKPVVLTVAGSDNSAGAGIQADLKTFSHFGCYGLTAVTCVVAEVPGRVSAIQAVKPDLVAAQIALSFEAFPAAAAKTGMLFSTAIIEAVADQLAGRAIPLVIDPVMVASSGDPLLRKSAVSAYRRLLFPRAALVTPNLDELKILSGREIRSLAQMKDAGRALVDRYGCAFLLKGGHLKGKSAVDILATTAGFEEFSAPFVRGMDPHGTGCTYSAAVAANLACGRTLSDSVRAGKSYITRAIAGHLRWGRTSALEHFPPSG
ncbi:MAG TPA: bifunctional hydroxymethylpyrimidine kinase/phosphomethylpyrimidine kinase [Terrimicrobiaceae bacterium]|nr:bifunctional hydroxymethylpyrimidine kinase/phosphomethylpyrimidine kinase [Terrimicrobiaceae bacterium]